MCLFASPSGKGSTHTNSLVGVTPRGENTDNKVLLFNSRVKLFGHGKLRSKWNGPCKVIDTSTHGAITIQDDIGNTFKVNGQCLKIYLEPQNNLVEELDMIEFIEFSH